MEVLGIGPLELVLIILLAIIIFGPKDIAKASKSVGKSLNKLTRSDTWKTINQTSQELKNLPNRLMRESGLDELEKATKEEMTRVDTAIHQSVESTPLVDTPPAVFPEQDNSIGANPSIEPTEKDSQG
jgi:sec-independent protein translocase protein TatB